MIMITMMTFNNDLLTYLLMFNEPRRNRQSKVELWLWRCRH